MTAWNDISEGQLLTAKPLWKTKWVRKNKDDKERQQMQLPSGLDHDDII